MTMKKLLYLLVFLVGATCAQAQLTERLDSLLAADREVGFNGNVLLSHGDSIRYVRSLGLADAASGQLLTEQSVFDLGSVSKQFTALSIVQLVEAGKLTFATEVGEVIEGFPYAGITVGHLLRHQSGLPDYMGLMMNKKNWDPKKIATNDDAIELLRRLQPPLLFPVGTEYSYSNTGYLLLGSIIERVAGMEYGEYLEQNVFLSAGMSDTHVYRRRYRPEMVEKGTEGHMYQEKKNRFVRVEKYKSLREYYYLDGIVGDGMVNSTLRDLEKWKVALRTNRLISAASMELMLTPDEVSPEYGYGLYIKDSDEYGRRIYHGGRWGGYLSMTYYEPLDNLFIVILCNAEYDGFTNLLVRLRKIFREESGG